jgi:hypothetical protein
MFATRVITCDVPYDAPIVKWEKSNLDDFDRMFTSDSKR